MGGCFSPKICAFKLSKGITDINPLCFWVLLVSSGKHPPATWERMPSRAHWRCHSAFCLPQQLLEDSKSIHPFARRRWSCVSLCGGGSCIHLRLGHSCPDLQDSCRGAPANCPVLWDPSQQCGLSPFQQTPVACVDRELVLPFPLPFLHHWFYIKPQDRP